MPESQTPSPVIVIFGDDEFTIKERGQQVFSQWQAQFGSNDAEIIDAAAGTVSEAEEALDQLEGALLTLPFFGGVKLIWFKNCSFLGEDRTAGSKDVTNKLTRLAEMLKNFDFKGIRLLITSGKFSATRTFYKVMAKIAEMEKHETISNKDRDWESKMEAWLIETARQNGKTLDPNACQTMVLFVGANLRQMNSELEKLIIYTGERTRITEQDVLTLVTRGKQSKSFALTDAIGNRDLPRAIRQLDNDLTELKADRSMSEVGILYGIISKVRTMLLLHEMIEHGYVSGGKVNIPDGILPNDKKFNPALMHPFMVKQNITHAKKYTSAELVHAMETLLECNRKLVFSGGDPALALQQAVIDIIRRS
ncbi:MAG: DNA polymerase III subunit delta [Verrucomicrobia bacterium]|nr:DNA polymerase III subunit delta [Verrucomicrobiota bacterium]